MFNLFNNLIHKSSGSELTGRFSQSYFYTDTKWKAILWQDLE